LSFTSGIITFPFLVAVLPLLPNFPFWLSTFVNYHKGLSLGVRRQGNCMHTLLSVSELSNTLNDQSQTDLERDDVIAHWLTWYLFSDLQTEKLTVKFLVYVITTSQNTIAIEIWIVFVGDWCSLTKLWGCTIVHTGTM
jgi:hypothetical protein